MKQVFTILALTVILLSGSFARADIRIGRDRPMFRGDLIATTRVPLAYPIPVTLTMNGTDGSGNEVTSFLLVENVGVRNLPTGPVAVQKATRFTVDNLVTDENDTAVYTAVEDTILPPTDGPMKRVLEVSVAGNWTGAPMEWAVRLSHFGTAARFLAFPGAVPTIQ
jgi:hypothetical protein